MNISSPECLWPIGATLGEGPMWHAAEQALYFVDIKGLSVHRCDADGGRRQSWTLPGQVGFVLPQAAGGLVLGLPGKLARLLPDSTVVSTLLELESGQPGNRLNDGYVAPDGALWFGSMDNGETESTGALYRWDGKTLARKDDGYVITNGPCISPDGRTFYHTDTLGKVIYAFDLAPDASLSNKRVLIRTEAPGHPDGTTIDAEGCLWVAMFRGRRIDRYAPDGRLLQSVAMPCSNITKLAFGGADLKTVFATTARKGLSVEELRLEPLAGSVFRFRVEVPGLPQHAFTGPAQ